MGKKSTIILFAVITMLVSSFFSGAAIVSETGMWPDSWPIELQPYRAQARTIMIAAGNQENVYEIRFENREEFEKLWPIILKLKDKKAPLRLSSIEKSVKKGVLFNSDKPVVRIFSHVYPAWPQHRAGGNKLIPAPPWPDSIKSPTGELPEYVAISEDGSTWIPVNKEERPLGFMSRARTEIELVVDGKIIDLNRILLPPDTPIIDRRFQEK
jgi:hypothetical protein